MTESAKGNPRVNRECSGRSEYHEFFEKFTEKDIAISTNHVPECVAKESMDSKEKAMEGVIQDNGNTEEIKGEQDETAKIIGSL